MLLTDVRVLELGTGVAAGYCGQLLGDLGAQVLRPRDAPVAIEDGTFGEALRRTLHRNKHVLDFDQGRDLPVCVAWADIVIVDHKESLERVQQVEGSDSVVTVAVTGFGLTGPLAAWHGSDLVAAAYGGGCQQNGDPGRAPLRPPAYVGDYQTGVNAALSALIGLRALRSTGLGQVIDVGAADTWATIQTAIGLLEFVFQGRVAQRSGRRFFGRPYPYTIVEGRDGEVRLICLTGHEWKRALEMMGDPEWGHDPRYADRQANAEHFHDELDGYIEKWLKDLPGDTLLERAIEYKVPFAPMRHIEEVLHEPQLEHRGFFWDDDGIRLPGHPAAFSRTSVTLRQSASNSQNQEVSVTDLGPPRDRGATRGDESLERPLEGIRILDLGWAWAGGAVGSLLADFGADVIKIESTQRLDPMRQDRPLLGGEPDIEQCALHHNVNRNKRSVAIDLGHPDGADLVRRLAGQCDVIIENFSPGVLDRLGLGYEQLHPENGGLVYLSLGAVGRTGPLTGVRAYAPVITALSGMDSLVGYPGEPPTGLQHGFGDPTASLHGALAIMAALHEREASGSGQHIDFSQLESLVAVLAPHVVNAQISGELQRPRGNRDPLMVPHGVYRAEGEDDWVAIACPDDIGWNKLVEAMGRPTWADDAAFATIEGRRRHEDEIDRELGEWTRQNTARMVASALQEAGIPAAPLLDTAERFSDDHLQQRDTYAIVEHPVVGSEFIYGVPWKFSKTPGEVRSPAPLLGEDTQSILREFLSLDDTTIRELHISGVLK